MSHDYTDAEKRVLDSIIRPVGMKHRVSARFKLRAMKGEFIMRESAWCKNLIVNGWFDTLFGDEASRGPRGFVAGAGTAAPLETDTALQSYLGGGNSFQDAWVTTNSTVSPRSFTVGMRIRASEGAVVGNVSEIALYYGSGTVTPDANRSLMNRARVVDELGNPTSISVLSDEFLEVVWEMTFYAIEGATGTLTINIDGTPTNFDYEIQPVSMNHINSWQTSVSMLSGNIGFHFNPSGRPSVGTSNQSMCYVTPQTVFGDPSLSTAPEGYNINNRFTSRTLGSYTAGSKARMTTVRLPLNNGNISAPGIRSINVALQANSASATWCTHQVLLDGPFIKPATHIFDLPVNVSMGNA